MSACQQRSPIIVVGGALAAALVTLVTTLTGVLSDDPGAEGGSAWSGSRWNAPGRTFFANRASERAVDLRGTWRFARGDDLAWSAPDYDDGTWQTVEVPGHWEDQGHADYDGYAWYRRRFTLPPQTGAGTFYLQLGAIDDADEVFLNGVLIGASGRFPPAYDPAWDASRTYAVPEGLVRPGRENVLAVRVYDGGGYGGIGRGDVKLSLSPLPAPWIDLAGWWKLRAADDPSYRDPAHGDDDFEEVRVPGHWDRQGLADFDGYAWYRKRFDLPAAPVTGRAVLLLGLIDDSDETYLNGIRIGETGAGQLAGDHFRRRRVYRFDAGLLRRQGNLLAVRVHDRQAAGGISAGPIGIMSESDCERYRAILDERRTAVWRPVWNWLLGR